MNQTSKHPSIVTRKVVGPRQVVIVEEIQHQSALQFGEIWTVAGIWRPNPWLRWERKLQTFYHQLSIDHCLYHTLRKDWFDKALWQDSFGASTVPTSRPLSIFQIHKCSKSGELLLLKPLQPHCKTFAHRSWINPWGWKQMPDLW